MKEFQIEAFKPRKLMSVEIAEKCWKIMVFEILVICNHNKSNLSFSELDRNAFNMMRHESGEQRYSWLVSIMTSQLEETAKSLEDHEGSLFLEELVWEWTTFITAVEMITDALMCMDESFIPRTQNTPVHDLGLDLWRDNIVRRTQIQVRLKYALPELVQRERRGEVINRGLMSHSVKMLLFFGPPVYRNVFEAPLLNVSHGFYRGESQLLIESRGCGDYLKETEKRLNEEAERVSNYMDPMTERHLIFIVESYMIENPMAKLVYMKNSGLVSMLMDDKYEDLARMYALFKRTLNGLGVIRKGIAAHIRNIGTQLTEPERLNDPVDFVQRLLDERDKYDKIINRAFNNDKMFQDDVNSSFEHFINLNPRVPEFISLFVDKKLREGLKGVSEEEVEIVLDKVMRLFRYLNEKDIFKKHYRQHFVKRLLSNTSVSEDAERSLILKLKTECGSEFTSKLELMFTNMKASDDTIKQFYEAMGYEFEDGPTLSAHIRDIGRQLVTDPERLKDPVDLVQRVLDERDKYNKIINLAFNNDKMFQDVVNSSFEHFINLNPRVPEFISLFVDKKLSEGLKGASKEEVEIVLDKVMRLFRYLNKKDIFEKHYRQHFVKRLLSNTSVSEDAERSLISKLETECGSEITSKLEEMFTDMKASDDTMKQFYEAMGHELGDGPTLAARVLGTKSWPIQSTTTCNLPSEILTVSDKFETYYSETHSRKRRRVTWQTNMGSADIIATFGNGQKHELHVSTYQMCVLMLFNSGVGLSYREIEKATNISTSDLKRCLQSLACIKGKNVLRKEPMSKDIGEDDVFFFNDKFSSEFDKVDVGTMVEFEFEKETRKRVKVDGKHQIDAAIVRIMKARGALDHRDLVSEVTKKLQSRFSPDRVEIKKRIESLIEREFLKRDKDNSELYRYLK